MNMIRILYISLLYQISKEDKRKPNPKRDDNNHKIKPKIIIVCSEGAKNAGPADHKPYISKTRPEAEMMGRVNTCSIGLILFIQPRHKDHVIVHVQ